MAIGTTKIANLINPEVMADMISAKIPKKIVVAPFAAIDLTLAGQPGDTITVPQYAYIGDAETVAEGAECAVTVLSATTTNAKVKKAMKAVELTDEAVLSGYGNPVAEANNQLAAAIASKVDADAMDVLLTATKIYDGTADVISYDGIVDAIDLFEEEANTEKVIFVHPKQVTQLRHDPDFVSADKYPGNVVMTGEIGMIANCRVVPSKKVPLETDVYKCPVIKLAGDPETDTESQAVTIYMKRDTTVETQRQSLKRITDISADKYYTVVLSNASKVLLAKFKATPPAQKA